MESMNLGTEQHPTTGTEQATVQHPTTGTEQATVHPTTGTEQVTEQSEAGAEQSVTKVLQFDLCPRLNKARETKVFLET